MRRYIGERLFDTLVSTPQASLVRQLYPSSFGTVFRLRRVPGQGNGLRMFCMKKDMGAE
jgi:hypothetical protein